jgi:hypothetical protein
VVGALAEVCTEEQWSVAMGLSIESFNRTQDESATTRIYGEPDGSS